MEEKYTYISNYNLFFLFTSIIWIPVQVYFLHVDGAGRFLLVLGTLAMVINFSSIVKNKVVFSSPVFICWILLVLYSIINSKVKGYVDQYGALHFFRDNYLSPLVFLIVVLIEMQCDRNKCLKVILCAQVVYVVIGAMNMSVSNFERGGNEELGNMLPLIAANSTFVSGILFSERQLKGDRLSFTLIEVLALYVIIASATRKALGAVIIVLVGVVLGRGRKLNARTLLVMVSLVVLLYLSMSFILSNTTIGTRLTEKDEKFDVPLVSNPKINDFLLTLLGDRMVFYYEGIILHGQSPVTGIGIMNYINLGYSDYRFHTEYMVQYCENGIVGFSLFCLFYILMFIGLNRKRKEGYNVWVSLFGLLLMLFLNLTTWTYNQHFAMIVYATIITEICSKPTIYEDCNTPKQKQLQ